jgi:protein-S-isoprenylcysteine O-methyltransferase Ste14/hypothetical membrane protein
MNILQNQKGMNIIGQGGIIMLFTLPSLIAAILVHTYLPLIAALPKNIIFIKPIGYVLLLIGILFWGTAVIQLLTGFTKSKLITTGAYVFVRNPIYSSAIFMILPGVSISTLTWVYFITAIFLYTGVLIFIGKEEKQLTITFEKEYEDYLARVNRLVPFIKPIRKKQQLIVFLFCGIIAPLLYVATDLLASYLYKGYNYADQAISELSAIGAPTQTFWNIMVIIINTLLIAFGMSVRGAGNKKRKLQITGTLLTTWGVIGYIWLLFPMNMRGAIGSASDTGHLVMSAVTVLLIIFFIGLGSTTEGNLFRYYSILTILAILTFGTLVGMQATRVAMQLPTPWMGIMERMSVYPTMLWVLVLAVILLKDEKKVKLE